MDPQKQKSCEITKNAPHTFEGKVKIIYLLDRDFTLHEFFVVNGTQSEPELKWNLGHVFRTIGRKETHWKTDHQTKSNTSGKEM